jgi:hypothetical protein
MSARENIAINIVKQLENMTDPALGSVSRVFFDVQKLAITQFPAIFVTTTDEAREDISTDLRRGTIRYSLKCYVRGTQIDTLRNEVIERVEEMFETNRGHSITLTAENIHNVSTEISSIEVVERELPLGEVAINVDVKYTYKKGVL